MTYKRRTVQDRHSRETISQWWRSWGMNDAVCRWIWEGEIDIIWC